MNNISCLLVETDLEAVRQIDTLCRRIGSIEVRWKTHSVQTGVDIIRRHHPAMVIVGLGANPETTIGWISTMARDFPSLYIVALSEQNDSGLILRTIRAGGHDFLCKPVQEIDLLATAEKVSNLRLSRKENYGQAGKVLSVFSNKGGNGTTTIAVNLADALVRLTRKKVVVVDLVFSHGDVTMFFNVKAAYSLMDLARDVEKADYDFLHALLIRHASGIYILADPPVIEDAEKISATQVRDILSKLRSMFDYVILDTPHHFDDRTLTALEMSDIVLLVSLLNLPTLRNTQKCLELFGRLGLRDERVRLVLNRFLPDETISKEKVEEILGCPVFFSIPNDYPTMISAINRGRLLSEITPDKEVSKSFDRMAELLAGSGPEKRTPVKKKGILESIFPRRSG
jgi:pilus assembly protein CpaE